MSSGEKQSEGDKVETPADEFARPDVMMAEDEEVTMDEADEIPIVPYYEGMGSIVCHACVDCATCRTRCSTICRQRRACVSAHAQKIH